MLKTNKEYNFTNLKPELVEKKEPPIIDNIRNIKERFVDLWESEKPIFETLLVNERNKILKLFSKLKKTKKIISKIKK